MSKTADPKAKIKKSATSKPKVVKPKAAKPKAVKPKAVKPKAVKPKAVKPKTGKPEATKPKAAIKTESVKKKKSFFSELLENVEQGAKRVSEKTSVLASDTFEKVKKGAAEALDASSQVVTDLYITASDYTEEFKDKLEMKKLNNRRNKLTSELGRFFYKKYRVEKVIFSKFSKTREFTALLKKVEKLDEEIVELGKHLSKK